MSAEPAAIAEAFARAISSQDVGAIAGLMAAGHVFIDSDGAAIRGRERMCAAWARGQVAVLVGAVEGTYAPDGELLAENHRSVPSVWRAIASGAAGNRRAGF